MASYTFFTPIFRASYAHLDKPQEPMNQGGKWKYKITQMFSKTGTCPKSGTPIDLQGTFAAALDKVCQEEWGISYQQAMNMVQNPPKFRDGDANFKKDAQGNPTQELVAGYAGMWYISAANEEQPGVVGPAGNDPIPHTDVYSGCYARAQVRAAAFTANNSRVVALYLENVQKCYEGERLDGNQREAATSAFGGMAVPNSDVQASGFGGAPQQGPGQQPQNTQPNQGYPSAQQPQNTQPNQGYPPAQQPQNTQPNQGYPPAQQPQGGGQPNFMEPGAPIGGGTNQQPPQGPGGPGPAQQPNQQWQPPGNQGGPAGGFIPQ